MEAISKKLEELRVELKENKNFGYLCADSLTYVSCLEGKIETLEWVLEQDFGINPCRIIHEQNLREDFIEGCETWLRRKLTQDELEEIDDYVLDEAIEEMFDAESKSIIDFCGTLEGK